MVSQTKAAEPLHPVKILPKSSQTSSTPTNAFEADLAKVYRFIFVYLNFGKRDEFLTTKSRSIALSQREVFDVLALLLAAVFSGKRCCKNRRQEKRLILSQLM